MIFLKWSTHTLNPQFDCNRFPFSFPTLHRLSPTEPWISRLSTRPWKPQDEKNKWRFPACLCSSSLWKRGEGERRDGGRDVSGLCGAQSAPPCRKGLATTKWAADSVLLRCHWSKDQTAFTWRLAVVASARNSWSRRRSWGFFFVVFFPPSVI